MKTFFLNIGVMLGITSLTSCNIAVTQGGGPQCGYDSGNRMGGQMYAGGSSGMSRQGYMYTRTVTYPCGSPSCAPRRGAVMMGGNNCPPPQMMQVHQYDHMFYGGQQYGGGFGGYNPYGQQQQQSGNYRSGPPNGSTYFQFR